MFAVSLTLALSGQSLPPLLVRPGADLARVARLLAEPPHGGCRPLLERGWPDYKRYYFDRNRLSVVVDWKGKVVSVERH